MKIFSYIHKFCKFQGKLVFYHQATIGAYTDKMLKQASVTQIRNGDISRQDGYVVIGMCYYPRGLRKELRDEYRSNLAPDRELFKDFKHFQKILGHEGAFTKSKYQQRFSLSERALDHLRHLSGLSRKQDVFLVCQCEVGQRCHREILMLIAHRQFGARIGRIYNTYLKLILGFKTF